MEDWILWIFLIILAWATDSLRNRLKKIEDRLEMRKKKV